MKNFDSASFTERIVLNAPMEEGYVLWINCHRNEDWLFFQS